MVEKSLCVLALVAALVPFAGVKAAAQDIRQTPPPFFMTAQQTPGTLAIPEQPPVLTYCDPGKTAGCLFYSGDINPDDPNTNGVPNGCTALYGTPCVGSLSSTHTALEVLAPFVIPAGQTWTVTKVFSNSLSSDSGTIDSGLTGAEESICYWGIRKGVASAFAGFLVHQHVNHCTSTLTGRNAFGFNEYQVLITASPEVVLTAGTYFLTAQPECINASDSNCTAQWFESDAENTLGGGTQGPLINAFGTPAPTDDSFFKSIPSVFNDNYEPTWGTSGVCSGIGCDQFSDGLLGKCTTTGVACP